MLNGKRIVVVMPAFNAAKTLETTARQVPQIVDSTIVVDDHSSDETVRIANRLGLKTFVHDWNRGYGANQKTCYREALAEGADIVIMLHPDYQYRPVMVTAIASMIAYGVYDVALGSRIIGSRGALSGGMPVYKYISNRILSAVQNMALNTKLSEFHTGLRGFSRQVLLTLPLLENSDDFVFDNEILVQSVFFGFSIGEVSCPTRYADDASSISFIRSIQYGFGVLSTSVKFVLQRLRLSKFEIFDREGKKIQP